ncbi:hypothetical protein SAMN02927916_0421 [Flavobacterium anhuiense]|uniref:Uncharacterized protein n=1 Tax=Flavobacterium anhuiense TaxID=459526 RepID=A0ABY0L6A8_9FLAO|nr:hypothetical protein [Flavobacterium anhuiense]SCX81542.1 hypothetical protein SAMN02927916_0421 [Flavobacterium anhuiense]
MESKTNQWKTFLFFVVVSFIIYQIYFVQKNDYRKSFKGEAIALVTINEGTERHKVVRYYFYTDRKILGKIGNRTRQNNLYKEINKFYKVKYDLNKPEENEIFLEEELKPDSLALVKAGFVKTKYYEYDDATGKYLEKSKWK